MMFSFIIFLYFSSKCTFCFLKTTGNAKILQILIMVAYIKQILKNFVPVNHELSDSTSSEEYFEYLKLGFGSKSL